METSIVNFDSLRCFNCNEYLITFPIYSHTKDNKLICGNCKNTNEDVIRNFAYETLAKGIKFPCRYSKIGCTEKFIPDELIDHQSTCKHKNFVCHYLICQVNGDKQKLLQHYEQAHSINIINDTYVFRYDKVLEGIEVEYLMQVFNEIFFISIKYGTQYVFDLKIFILDNCDVNKKYKYKICPYSNEKNKFIEMKTNYTIPAGKPLEVFHNLGKHKVFQINIQIDDRAKIMRSLSELNRNILKCLKCPICLEYMTSPIFQCDNGHAICDNCEKKLRKCPSCRHSKRSRCLLVENMAEEIVYPCKYLKCFTADKINILRKHESLCPYKPYECPLQPCEFPGNKFDFAKLNQHFQAYHQKAILKSNVITVDITTKLELYIVPKHDALFLLCHKFLDDNFYLSVQLLAPRGAADKFYLDVSFGEKNSFNSIIMKRKCAEASCDVEPFSNKETFLILNLSLLQPFIVENKQLRYEVEIVHEKH